MTLRHGDGIHLRLESGDTVAFDSRAADADVNVASHAHTDHLPRAGASEVVCSRLTADLAGVRNGGQAPTCLDHPCVELLPAGHVAGSRAARVTDPGSGRTYLYTGDVCTRDRFYLEGFQPVPADVLVIESTYGTPDYVLPEQDELFAEIHDWLDDTMDRPVVLLGYALGRAQRLQSLLGESVRERCFATEGIREINAAIEAGLGVDFRSLPFDADVELGPGDALVATPWEAKRSPVADAIRRGDALTAGFSGWAIDSSFRYRRGVDAAFPLSDHCDFRELTDLVEAVDPERVYTHHGAADEFATHLTAELGVEARSLKRNQTTLAEF